MVRSVCRWRRSGLARLRVQWLGAVTILLLGSLAAAAAPTRSTPAPAGSAAPSVAGAARLSAGTLADRAAAAAPAPDPPAATHNRFLTLRPGSRLRDDAQCGELIRRAPETEPTNAVPNGTPGTQRLPVDFFPELSNDPRAATVIAPRVNGSFTGTTDEILQWGACKWGIDERYVRAQATVESSWRQSMMGDWTANAEHCAPGHGIGVDGRPDQCPESWGILQVRYRFFQGAFPEAITSTPFNVDTAYAVWRACYEGYEVWLKDVAAPGHEYKPGDHWGCIGRWFSGKWYDPLAESYIDCVRRVLYGREPCP